MDAACTPQPGQLSHQPMAVTGEVSVHPGVLSIVSEDLSTWCQAGCSLHPQGRARGQRCCRRGLLSLQRDDSIYDAVLEAGPGFILSLELWSFSFNSTVVRSATGRTASIRAERGQLCSAFPAAPPGAQCAHQGHGSSISPWPWLLGSFCTRCQAAQVVLQPQGCRCCSCPCSEASRSDGFGILAWPLLPPAPSCSLPAGCRRSTGWWVLAVLRAAAPDSHCFYICCTFLQGLRGALRVTLSCGMGHHCLGWGLSFCQRQPGAGAQLTLCSTQTLRFVSLCALCRWVLLMGPAPLLSLLGQHNPLSQPGRSVRCFAEIQKCLGCG